MPSFAEMRQFLGGQLFQTPQLPHLDLSGKTIVVTGANTGLGFECAKHLANMKLSKLILACRNLEKGEAAKLAIQTSHPDSPTSIEVWQVDLDQYSSVISFSERITATLGRLDGLVANAGIETTTFRLSEGLERTLTVNVTSTFLLSILLLPQLQQTAKTHTTPTNLAVVGSMIHVFAPYQEMLAVPSATTIFEGLSDAETADMDGRYFLSKLIVHQCCRELVGRLSARPQSGAGVVVNWNNPGWCGTELSRDKEMGVLSKVCFAVMGRSAEEGSRCLVHAVTAGWETHGMYLSECRVKVESEFVRSEEGRKVQERLWSELSAVIERARPGALDFLR